MSSVGVRRSVTVVVSPLSSEAMVAGVAACIQPDGGSDSVMGPVAPLPMLLMVKEYSREAPLVIVVAMRSRLAVSRARGERA